MLLDCGCIGSRQPTIAMVPKGSRHEFWQVVRAGAQRAATEYGFRLEWRAPASEADTGEQIRILNMLVDQRVAAISLAPIDRKALVPAVRRAADAGIPVSVFDSAIDIDSYISFVATDNAAGGRLAARRMGKILEGKGSVAIVSFMPGSAATVERDEAFQEEVRLLFPKINIVALQYGMADAKKAAAVTRQMLNNHPDLVGIFSDNESSSVGVATAIGSANAHIKVVAFDSSEYLIQGLRTGLIDSLVVQNPFRMGYEAIRVIAMKLGGSEPPAFIDSGCQLISAQDLDSQGIQDLLHPGAPEDLQSRMR